MTSWIMNKPSKKSEHMNFTKLGAFVHVVIYDCLCRVIIGLRRCVSVLSSFWHVEGDAVYDNENHNYVEQG